MKLNTRGVSGSREGSARVTAGRFDEGMTDRPGGGHRERQALGGTRRWRARGMGVGRWRAELLLIAAVTSFAGCATTGATLGSGVGDRAIDSPPYYAGTGPLSDPARIAHLPIVYQRGATDAEIFEPEASAHGAVSALLRDINRTLDDLRGSPPVELVATAQTVPPDVMFGCDSRATLECEFEEDFGPGGRPPPMRLAVGRPSPDWVQSVATSLDGRSEDHVLVITLEIGEYWAHQKNWQGAKEVRLGTGHSQKLPWLTSLEQPVRVVQLTGVVVNREGRAVRIGAEGLVAKQTHILLSAFGAQAMVSDEDVEGLITMRRDDLAGAPLVWEVALTNLVRQLTGDGVMR